MDLGQIFTGEIVAAYMVAQLSCEKDDKILEPCFGGGAFLKAFQDQGYINVDGCEIDMKLFNATKSKYPAHRLFCEDFLSFAPNYKYKGIIMNPPYIRHEKIDDLKELGITKKNLRKNPIYNGLPSTANLYMYFLIKAIDLLCEDGELIVIFPSSWMMARSGETFKKMLFTNTSIVKETYVNGAVFDKDALVDVVILKLVKNKVFNKVCKPSHMELVGDKLLEKEEISDMNLCLNTSFATYSKIRRGLTTGWNTMFINPVISLPENQKFLRKIISTPKAIVGYNTDSAETDDLLMISPGESLGIEIVEYISAFEKQLSKERKPKTLYEKVQQSKEWYTLSSVDSDGILFSYFVRNDMKFVMNTTNTLARDNFYIIYPRIDRYLMFALLNNYYTYYQLEMIGKKYGAGLLKLQKYDIENLKFVDVERITSEDIGELILLAKDLAENSNPKDIEKITKIISKYVGTESECIIRAYENIKRRRLEAS